MTHTKEVSAEEFFTSTIPGYAAAVAERDRLREQNRELVKALEAAFV